MARRRKSRSLLPFGRLIGPPASIVMLLVGAYLAYSGNVPFASSIFGSGSGINTFDPQILASAKGPGARSADKIRIGTYNLKIFGDSKASKNDVMNYLAWIVRQFDVLAVQEIKCSTDEPIHKLMELVNAAEGPEYTFVVSNRLQREGSGNPERYAFIWDTSRIQMRQGSQYEVEDDGDFMHREPFVASFRAVTTPAIQAEPFTFTLINVHTDPDEVRQEMDVMDDVFLSVRAFEQQDDVIVLGDLNAEPDGFGQLGQISGVRTLNTLEKTNTAGSRTIDHIVVDASKTTEFRNVAGVIDYERDLGLTREQADLISDHRPVFAEFDVTERTSTSVLASRPSIPPPLAK